MKSMKKPMQNLTFEDILGKLRKTKFDKFDIVVAIGRGGIVPGALVANHLKLDFAVLWLNFRDDNHCPRHEKPKLVRPFKLNLKGKKVLLVDDLSRTGSTLAEAKKILKGAKVKTLVVNGKSDYSLYDFEGCAGFPWN